jgi:hypothetical protein
MIDLVDELMTVRIGFESNLWVPHEFKKTANRSKVTLKSKEKNLDLALKGIHTFIWCRDIKMFRNILYYKMLWICMDLHR